MRRRGGPGAARARGTLVTLVALSLVAAVAAPARAQPARPGARRPMVEAALEHFNRGLAAYKERFYVRAAAEFRAGHAIDPHPDFLFPWAQAERLAGRCREAVGLYRQVLAMGLEAEEERTTRRLMDQCAAQLARDQPDVAAASKGPPQQPPGPSPGPSIDAGAAAEQPARRWYRDMWGGALLGAGAVGAAIGTGFLVSADRADRSAVAADMLDEFDRDTDRAAARRRVGFIALGAGGALITAAVVRYIFAARDERAPDQPGLTLWMDPDTDGRSPSFAAGLHGRF